jgi:hypothetical protein
VRQHERTAVVTRGQHHRERAANGTQLAGQRELARELVRGQLVLRQLSAGDENADGDRQVEASRFLRQVGRRERDRDLACRKLELRILERRAHAVARFTHLGFGKPDDVHAGQAAREMHLDADAWRADPGQGTTVDDGDRHPHFPSAPEWASGHER